MRLRGLVLCERNVWAFGVRGKRVRETNASGRTVKNPREHSCLEKKLWIVKEKFFEKYMVCSKGSFCKRMSSLC